MSLGILGTDMVRAIRMTLDCNTATLWLPSKPPTKYKLESNPNSLP